MKYSTRRKLLFSKIGILLLILQQYLSIESELTSSDIEFVGSLNNSTNCSAENSDLLNKPDDCNSEYGDDKTNPQACSNCGNFSTAFDSSNIIHAEQTRDIKSNKLKRPFSTLENTPLDFSEDDFGHVIQHSDRLIPEIQTYFKVNGCNEILDSSNFCDLESDTELETIYEINTTTNKTPNDIYSNFGYSTNENTILHSYAPAMTKYGILKNLPFAYTLETIREKYLLLFYHLANIMNRTKVLDNHIYDSFIPKNVIQAYNELKDILSKNYNLVRSEDNFIISNEKDLKKLYLVFNEYKNWAFKNYILKIIFLIIAIII